MVLLQAYKLYKKGKSLDMMDDSMAPSANPDQVAVCIQIGLLCTQSEPQLRPNMRRVVVMLSRKPGTLDEPTRPGYPGRYRRTRKTNNLSTSGTSGESSRSFGSTTNTNMATATATATTLIPPSPRADPHGKRPMEYKPDS